MKDVQNASFICGWARQQQDPGATPHLFTLSLKTFRATVSSPNIWECADDTLRRLIGGWPSWGECPAEFALAPEGDPCRLPGRKHIMPVYKATRGAVSHPRALFAADFFASYFLPEFGGKCWNIFSVSLSKFLMLLLEFPDRSSLADPLHKRLFVFPSKRSTISVPTL
jgi:hypothetical protein